MYEHRNENVENLDWCDLVIYEIRLTKLRIYIMHIKYVACDRQ